MKNKKSGAPGNGLGHKDEWNGGTARYTATASKGERKRRNDRRQKQKGWE
jgi:hypothetical protein